MDPNFFLSRSRLRAKTPPGTEFSCMCALGYRAESRWWQGKKKCFLKYLNLNSKFSILGNFPNDGSIFPTASKKINQKAQGKKKLAGEGAYVPLRHLVVKGNMALSLILTPIARIAA